MPFLTVLTRCYKRPRMLARNVASLKAQTDPDYEQLFIVDEVGLGIGESYKRMAAMAGSIQGQYAFILDDDDLLVSPTFIAGLKDIVARRNPDLVMVRMNHGPRGILPSKSWGKRPVQGDIGCSAYVVRREVWQAHAKHFTADYAGDFSFIGSIFDGNYNIYWFDCIASRVQQIGLGKAENAYVARRMAS